MNDSLTKSVKPPIGGLKKGIAANRQAYEQKMSSIDPKTVPNRLGIVMDDSGSMGHQGMEDAHSAVKAFTQSCNPMDTSIAVYPLNAGIKSLIVDYDILNMYVGGIWATGGTPLYSLLDSLIDNEPLTRAIVFSDGSPTDSHIIKTDAGYSWGDDGSMAVRVVGKYIEKKIPVDTVAIGQDSNELKELAKQTGGTYIRFQDTKSLSTGLKYLSPKLRGYLANPEVKAKIERGETI